MRSNFFDEFEDIWEDFDIRIGPFRWGIESLWRKNIRYTRTQDRHILRIRINPEIKKEQIKVRLIEPGIIEVSWPLKHKVEDIPVE